MALYQIRTCISIFHGATNDRLKSHSHTVELSLYLFKPGKDMLNFSKVETAINNCLQPYHGQFLNEMPEFKEDTSIEQIGEVLYVKLQEAMDAYGLTLERFEIGETPLRTYIIRRENDTAS